jgi:hypothetical protein
VAAVAVGATLRERGPMTFPTLCVESLLSPRATALALRDLLARKDVALDVESRKYRWIEHETTVRMRRASAIAGNLTQEHQMKKLLMSSVMLLAVACGVTPSPKSPCPGLYCIEVEVPSVPGYPSLCYASRASMYEAKAQLEARGLKVSVDQ